MNRADAINLLKKYNSGSCNEEEKGLVETFYIHYKEENLPALTEDQIAFLISDEHFLVKTSILIWKKIAAVAAILIVVSFSLYLFFSPGKQEVDVKPVVVANEIPAGGKKAVLTLADGTQVALNDAKNGIVATQEGVRVSKTEDGKLDYFSSGKKGQSSNAKEIYNKIDVPVGGEFFVALPDGTKVWLNSASSLKYPVVFNGKDRKVELNGEAYFEVVSNKARPFKVITRNQLVEVLGTHFNINAYSDESAIHTTLLEGAVRVENVTSKNSKLLKPGQQSAFKADGVLAVTEVDAESMIAWKSGYFRFKDENIQSIMRKIARWYDVEVSYEGVIPVSTFGGVVPRSKSLSSILKIMEITDKVHFKVNGRRVTVMK